MTILVPVLTAAIVSIFFGSVAAALVSHSLSSFRADKEYRLKKLEELFVSIEAASRNLLMHYHYLAEVARGQMTWETAHAKGVDPLLTSHAEYSAAMMIASIYFLDLTHVVDRLRLLQNDVQEKREAFMQVQKDGAVFAEYEREFKIAIVELKKRREEANERVFEAAKEVRRGRVLSWLRDRLIGP